MRVVPRENGQASEAYTLLPAEVAPFMKDVCHVTVSTRSWISVLIFFPAGCDKTLDESSLGRKG